MQESPYQAADAGDSLSDSGFRRLNQTVDAGESLSDSGCSSLSIRQRMQETLYQTAEEEYLFQSVDAGVSP